MKKHLLTSILVFAWFLQFGQVNAQTTIPNVNLIVSPERPTATDSILLIYTYTSNDGCPDYYLAIDSVAKNKIFVVRKSIMTKQACTAVVTQFKTTLNLGILEQNTQIYFEKYLIKIITYQCVLDKLGVVVWGQNECAKRLYIEDTSSPNMSPLPQLYVIGGNSMTNAVSPTKLKAGDQVKFGGLPMVNDSVLDNPCHIVGIATCYELVDINPCIMDKKGEVTAFIDNSSIVKSDDYIYSIPNVKLEIGTRIEFKGILIQCIKAPCYNIIECYKIIETPPTPCVMDKKGVVVNNVYTYGNTLFVKEYSTMSNYILLYRIDNLLQVKLKVGDDVMFGAKLISKDSVSAGYNRIMGDVTCIKVISSVPCVMDKKGEVVAIIDKSSIVKSGEYSYSIPNIQLEVGTRIEFKGTLIQCIKEPCYNVVECYRIIETPPTPCVMDKKGVVIGGIQGYGNTLFVAEYSPINSYKPLYRIENSLHIKLNVGDEVKFGAKMIANDSVLNSVNRIVGVVTCLEIISSTPTPCVLNRTGKVVSGNGGCANELFIQDLSIANSRLMLYQINPIISPATKITPTLRVGDEVRFGGVTFQNDSLKNNPCEVAGIAYCYELIQKPVGSFTLKGKAMVGKELMKSGMVYLFRKGNPKPQAVTSIVDSIYQFSNVLSGLYTVYVIPNIMEYPTYLPTFYINKFRYSQANYINFNEDKNDVVVMLNSYDLPKGNGIVRGNIFFESLNLKDSVMSALVQYRGASYDNDRSAANIPVTLYDGFGDAVAWSVSDEHGNYAVEDLARGSYMIVSETGSAKAESAINLADDNSIVNADLILKVVEEPTGFENIKHQITDYYPNPVSDIFNLKIDESTEVYLYNAIGKLILRQQLNAGVNTIDFSNLQQGIYLLKTNNSTIKVRKD